MFTCPHTHTLPWWFTHPYTCVYQPLCTCPHTHRHTHTFWFTHLMHVYTFMSTTFVCMSTHTTHNTQTHTIFLVHTPLCMCILLRSQHLRTYTHSHTHTHSGSYTLMHVYIFMSTTFAYEHNICVHIHIYTHMHTHIHHHACSQILMLMYTFMSTTFVYMSTYRHEGVAVINMTFIYTIASSFSSCVIKLSYFPYYLIFFLPRPLSYMYA